MTTPYLNPALTNLRAEINKRWPNRDKASDGWIGDVYHQATNSDHNPDPDGSVDALDIDVDGINVSQVLTAAVTHEATWYVIYNRHITSRSRVGGLGTWYPYEGVSPHTEHIHVNTRSAYENSSAPWFVTIPTIPVPPVPTWEDRMIMRLPIAKLGSTGPETRSAQALLCARGFTTAIDGNFGPHSRTQTIALQRKAGAESLDGAWGPETWAIGLVGRDVQ